MFKKILASLLLVLCIFTMQTSVNAITFEELGLTEEDIKYLSPAEREEILNPKTSPGASLPQDAPTSSAVAVPETAPTMGEGITSCFDYYAFGSVQADFSASSVSVSAGTPVTFSGKVLNANSYPIVGGSLVIKIFKAEENREKNVNGPDVVDEFVVLDNVSIAANGSAPIEFEWNVPSFALTGQYKATAFFVSADKFNLLGLSFTDDVVGNSTSFEVTGEKEIVQFNKDGVTLNGESHRFAAFPPRISKDVKADIAAEILNETAETQNIVVSWKVYTWDSRDEANLITEYTETVTVAAKGKTKAQFTVEDNNHPVYYVVAEVKYKDTKSILGIRFVRDGVDQTRINFPAVTGYPLKSGVENTVFSCLHGMGTSPVVADGRLVLTLKDGVNVIHTYEYKGDVLGAMMGVKDTFTPKQNYNNFTLLAEL